MLITLIVAALIPQAGQADQHQQEHWRSEHAVLGWLATSLGLDDLYTSWWVLALTGLLALFLAYDFMVRLRKLTRAATSGAMSSQTRKVRLGIYGSLFFHLCLLALLLGAVVDLLWGFHGTLYLTEGQAERERSETYAFVRSGPLGERSHRDFIMRHVSYDDAYAGYGQPTPAALIRFYDGQTIAGERWIAVNHPARFRGVRVFLGGERGYTPRFVVEDTARIPQMRSFIRLASQRVDGNIVHADYVPQLGDRHLYCLVENEDSLRLQLELGTDSTEVLAASLVPPASIILGDLRISVNEVRRWSRFELSYHPGENIVFAAFWGAVIGLACRFAFPRPSRKEAI
jgi:cytochrome c biogenesis protein ResB